MNTRVGTSDVTVQQKNEGPEERKKEIVQISTLTHVFLSLQDNTKDYLAANVLKPAMVLDLLITTRTDLQNYYLKEKTKTGP